MEHGHGSKFLDPVDAISYRLSRHSVNGIRLQSVQRNEKPILLHANREMLPARTAAYAHFDQQSIE